MNFLEEGSVRWWLVVLWWFGNKTLNPEDIVYNTRRHDSFLYFSQK